MELSSNRPVVHAAPLTTPALCHCHLRFQTSRLSKACFSFEPTWHIALGIVSVWSPQPSTAPPSPFIPLTRDLSHQMAIYSAVPPPEELVSNLAPSQLPPHTPSTPVTNGAIDIDAWTIQALQSLSISPVARGTGTPLAINIDDCKVTVKTEARALDLAKSKTPDVPRRPPSARDSQRKRDAVLRGKEGSRQRRRWENGMMLRTVAPGLHGH